VQVIEDEGLLDNALAKGDHALQRLRIIKERHNCIGDIRGLGLMIGIEFVRGGMEPDSEGLKKVILYCRERGLIILECGVDRNIIRLAPPLIVTKGEIDRGLDILEEAINKTNPGC